MAQAMGTEQDKESGFSGAKKKSERNYPEFFRNRAGKIEGLNARTQPDHSEHARGAYEESAVAKQLN
jgi:hypothetical protein